MPNSIENREEELLTTVDVNRFITKLAVNVQATLDKLKAFSEKAGRRTISELNQIADATELNEFLRIVYNDEHPTLHNKQQIRPSDFVMITRLVRKL